MQINKSNWQPYMDPVQMPPPMPMPNCPYYDMTEDELEEMYPRIYHIAYPRVVDQCNKMESEYGRYYTPSKEQLAGMVEETNKKVCDDIEESKKQGISIKQWRRDSRELPDLITILLLREIIGRRSRRYPRDPYYGRSPGYRNGRRRGYY